MKTYLVGGAVRDSLLGRNVKDRDYVVVGSSAAEMLAAGFEQVGQGFPVFLHPETGEEYALARREKKVGSGYTGFEFETGSDVTLIEDLRRRDLTINSMAFDESGSLIDPYGGSYDLESRQLRHTSAAFAEDPLRVVRLARFYARYKSLGFTVASETLQLCSEMVARGDLDELPCERFWAELEKAFSDTDPAAFIELLDAIGALNKVTFFKKLFGAVSAERVLKWMSLATAALIFNNEYRVDVFVACVMQHEHDGHYNTSHALKLHNMLGHINGLGSHPTALEWHNALSKCRAFSGEAGVWLFAVLHTLEKGLGTAPAKARAPLVRKLIEAGQIVTADNYQHLVGKAIGDAMAAERVDRIDMVLSQHHPK